MGVCAVRYGSYLQTFLPSLACSADGLCQFIAACFGKMFFFFFGAVVIDLHFLYMWQNSLQSLHNYEKELCFVIKLTAKKNLNLTLFNIWQDITPTY